MERFPFIKAQIILWDKRKTRVAVRILVGISGIHFVLYLPSVDIRSNVDSPDVYLIFAGIALTLSLPNLAKSKISKFHLLHFEKQISPCVSTGRELSFEWSHYRSWFADSKLESPYKTPLSTLPMTGLKLFQVSIYVHPCHPLQQTTGNIFNALNIVYRLYGLKF